MLVVIEAFIIVWVLWPLYVFCMAMERAHREKRVSLFAWVLAFPFIACALALDIILNFTIASLVFMEFPKRGEWMISQRMNRLVKDPGWRGVITRWVADNLLDPYDSTGSHIKRD